MSPVEAALLVLGAITALLFLVLVVRLHALLALLAVSSGVAILGGIPLHEVTAKMQEAMGGVLGYIAVVIGLGAIFGEMLDRSGAAQRIANGLLNALGESKAPTAFGITGLLVAIPVFFDVAFILMLPLLHHASRKSGRPVLAFALPLLAGLAVAHAFIPPTPGPVAVAGLLGADLGWVIVFGLAAGIPSLIVAGLLFGGRIGRKLGPVVTPPQVEPPQVEPVEVWESRPEGPAPSPGFGLALSLILLPTGLIVAATASKVWLTESPLRSALQFLGHPFTALLLTCLVAAWVLGRHCGWSRQEVERMATRSLEPVGAILLITGAGGVLGKMILATGAGDTLAQLMHDSGLPLLLLAFLLAFVMRLAQGSATVSMVTAAGLVAPVVEVAQFSPPTLGLLTIAIASGATAGSHVNDSGFWLVSRYLGLSEAQTLRTWTPLTLLIGGTGLAVVLLLSPFV